MGVPAWGFSLRRYPVYQEVVTPRVSPEVFTFLMKKIRAIGLSFLVAFGWSAPVAFADVEISAGFQVTSTADFYDPLGSLGTWVDLPQYGRCWHPNGVPPDWQPYVDGQWVWTDAGWYWQTDEPWAWACYHYGDWVVYPAYGWCWIPGTEWAPSWVTWRVSGDTVGWAPCGPNLSVLAPSAFVFVGLHDFHHHFHGRHDFMEANPTIINQTHVINNFTQREVNIDGRRQRIAVNEGLPVDRVEHATGTKFTARPVAEVYRQAPRPNAQQEHLRQTPNRPGGEQRNYEQPREAAPSGRPTPESPRQAPPSTGREHGSLQPPDQRPVQPPNEHPAAPSPSETRPYQAPREVPNPAVPPTGREHGSVQPPEQRRPGQTPGERPVPPAPSETHPYQAPREVPTPSTPSPTGREHGSVQPPDQPSVHSQPPAEHRAVQQPNRSVASPYESSRPVTAPTPTGREHGSAQLPERPATHAQTPPQSSEERKKQAE